MKKISVKIVISALILALMLSFAGCGGPSTIQEYIESSDEAQQQEKLLPKTRTAES